MVRLHTPTQFYRKKKITYRQVHRKAIRMAYNLLELYSRRLIFKNHSNHLNSLILDHVLGSILYFFSLLITKSKEAIDNTNRTLFIMLFLYFSKSVSNYLLYWTLNKYLNSFKLLFILAI